MMIKFLRTYQCDENGATAVEYGLVVAAVAVTIIVAINGFGDALLDLFEGLPALLSE